MQINKSIIKKTSTNPQQNPNKTPTKRQQNPYKTPTKSQQYSNTTPTNSKQNPSEPQQNLNKIHITPLLIPYKNLTNPNKTQKLKQPFKIFSLSLRIYEKIFTDVSTLLLQI